MRCQRLYTSLFGSLGVHGGFLVWSLSSWHPTPHEVVSPDAWLGSSVDVDTNPDPAAIGAANQPEATRAEPKPAPPSEATPATPPNEQARDAPLPTPRPTVKQAERARSPRPAEPSATGAPATAPGEPNVAPASSAHTGGAFGSEGLPAGVRNLPSAFTRAITRAASLDPVWRTLPAGKAGNFTIAVEVDEPGHIASADFERPSPSVPIAPELTRLRDRVVGLLGGGQFALSSGSGAGSDRLHIAITLSDGAGSDEANPEDVLELGFEPPRTGNVGRAHFRLGSGRRFEAVVVVLTLPAPLTPTAPRR